MIPMLLEVFVSTRNFYYVQLVQLVEQGETVSSLMCIMCDLVHMHVIQTKSRSTQKNS